MDARRSFDPTRSADRRRFYLQRARRKNTLGSGSALDRLMALPRKNVPHMDTELFGGLPAMLIGAHAAAVYAPERTTEDVDVVVEHASFGKAEQRLIVSGWTKENDLGFPNAKLGLYGSAWSPVVGGPPLDVISSRQPWLREAFAAPEVRNAQGARVLPRPYLVLMKLDSARGIDQGDLTRILGRLSASEVDDVIAVVQRNYSDSEVADDIRQYAEIGRWEYESGRKS
jgi:hypothetical protein